MVASSRWAWLAFWVLAGAVLLAVAARRGPEYDEAYTIFLALGTPRPDWPDIAFQAGEAWDHLAGRWSLAGIATDLRRTDVHPPLYFWAAALWRDGVGPSLFGIRALSVACALAALGSVGAIARHLSIAPLPAMLLTLGCYGFTYTGALARGFALAQLLNLLGVWLLLRAQGWHMAACAGALLGAASLTNYLASFIGAAALAWAMLARPRAVWLPALGGFLAFLPLDLWFFLAQRASRGAQFPPFAWGPSIERLAQYMAANILGGLPLYAGPARPVVAATLAGVLVVLAGLLIWRWRLVRGRWLLGACAAAPALGLLGLGVLFDTTPIELRYLGFATPFIALLLAGLRAALPRRPGQWLLGGVLSVQVLAIAGLMTRAETMQPQTAATRAAAALAGPDGLVLLPRGNDGVGLVGSVLLAAPADLRLALVRPADDPARLRELARAHPRLVLALLAVDAESRATLPLLTGTFTANECWREIPAPANLRAYINLCQG